MSATVIDDVTLLKASTQPRSGTPDGNIYFNSSTGELEIIIDSELATVDFGSGPVANPLTLDVKPTLRAIYQLHQSEREGDEAFRQRRPFLKGRFKLGLAFDFIYGRTAGADRGRIASSGWREFGGAVGTDLNRIYYNTFSLQDVLPTSQLKYQLSANGAVSDFVRPGNHNEAVQVFGTTANGDTGAGNFDTRTYFAVTLRTYGQRHDRLAVSESGISELEGYGSQVAISESPHPTTSEANYPIADVYGGSAVAPFSGITFDVLSIPETKTGFNESDGDFSLVIKNPNNATLDQVIAWIDASALQDADVSNTANPWNGLQREQLYSFDANGMPNFIPGVFIESLPASDQQRLKIFADNGDAKTFPFVPEVRIGLPAVAVGTATGWYHAWIEDGASDQDYDKNNAVTMQDSVGSDVKGIIGASHQISFGVSYDTFSLAGIAPGTDFNIVFTIGSDGEFEEQTIVIPITRTSLIERSISTIAENNI